MARNKCIIIIIVVWPAQSFSCQKIHTLIGLSVITMQLLGIPHDRVRKMESLKKWRFLGQMLVEDVWVRKGANNKFRESL